MKVLDNLPTVMSKRFLAALLCLAISTWTRADHPPIPPLPVTYAPNDDSFYQEQYRALYVKTGLSIRSAYRTVLESEMYSKSLGLTTAFQFRYPIRVEIKNIPEESLYRGLQGTAGWEKVDGQWVHVLTLNIGAYIQNHDEDVNALLAHEMAHIVLADFMGVEETVKIPRWLNEGLAQSVTNEGRSRVSDLATSLGWTTSMLLPCELDAPEDTFAHGEGNYQCYPEYYLATERVNQLGGISAAGKILRDLRNNASFADAFQSATGTDYSFFQHDVDAFMADVITDRKPNP